MSHTCMHACMQLPCVSFSPCCPCTFITVQIQVGTEAPAVFERKKGQDKESPHTDKSAKSTKSGGSLHAPTSVKEAQEPYWADLVTVTGDTVFDAQFFPIDITTGMWPISTFFDFQL